MSAAKGFVTPFCVAGYVHPINNLASGVKDADGMWVAKCHPLNDGVDDAKRLEEVARLFAAAPELQAAAYLAEEYLNIEACADNPPAELMAVVRALANALAKSEPAVSR